MRLERIVRNAWHENRAGEVEGKLARNLPNFHRLSQELILFRRTYIHWTREVLCSTCARRMRLRRKLWKDRVRWMSEAFSVIA